MTDKEIKTLITSGELDINAQALFLKILYKGFIYNLNDKIKIRGAAVPHIIINTGDDIMWSELRGYDFSKEPFEPSNENGIYNIVPRAIVNIGGINMSTDQLTSPYTMGMCNIEYEDRLISGYAEMKRMPLQTSLDVEYYLDTFTDTLECTQSLLSNLAFVNNFSISYLGQTIPCAYKLPESVDKELNLEFDGLSVDSKLKTVKISYELETNFPIYNNKTFILSNEWISKTKANLSI